MREINRHGQSTSRRPITEECEAVAWQPKLNAAQEKRAGWRWIQWESALGSGNGTTFIRSQETQKNAVNVVKMH